VQIQDQIQLIEIHFCTGDRPDMAGRHRDGSGGGPDHRPESRRHIDRLGVVRIRQQVAAAVWTGSKLIGADVTALPGWF
jgi:hypothetical protein